VAAFPDLPPGLLRPGLAVVEPYEPGRPIEDVQRELGLASVIKLASNEGPHPPMPRALAAIATAAAEQRMYPDPGAWALRDALAERLRLDPSQVLVGNGADSLVKLLCMACLDAGDALAMAWPSFPSWRQGAMVQGAEAVCAPLAPDGSYDLEALLAAIGERTKIAVVVSPNNPCGAAVDADALVDFLDRLPPHVLPALDEAYFEYLPAGSHDGAALVREGRPFVVLRTFSKAFGLAGLRVGYMLAPPALIRELHRVRNAFDVNGIAQAAALGSLADADAHLPERVALAVSERERLAAGLRALGLAPLPSVANFVFVELGPDRTRAAYEALLARGVIVRPTRAFGAPGALRITAGWPEENDRFLAALAEVLAELPEARALSA
jgi:histidinol-phosphate aminotransferase